MKRWHWTVGAVMLISWIWPAGRSSAEPGSLGQQPPVGSDTRASQAPFEPIRYRPLAEKVAGLDSHRQSLDGHWKLIAKARPDLRSITLQSEEWKDYLVPGQWRQQGFKIPESQTAAVARAFTIPRQWSGYRIFLRFDAIHAGTHYWINGHPLGYSENLFTPVEWDITPWVEPDKENRLDLEMKVDTVSEKLAATCWFAGHSLGGIDRAVSIYALPEVHVKALRLSADLDAAYRDGELTASATLENAGQSAARDVRLEISLEGPDGRRVAMTASPVGVDVLSPGGKTAELKARVTKPLKWNAEKPHLYKLAIELYQGSTLLERIERNMGFRKVEVRGSQVLLNGMPLKVAGACHLEIDPLTGRANTMRHAETDVKLVKAANLNYMRTTTFPPTMELVEAADRLGVYVDVEAPLAFIKPQDGLAQLNEILLPTSAMVDFYHSHPSVLWWSLANESAFNESFEVSDKMVKRLDPTRPTTFNSLEPGKKRIGDILNCHYPHMPYDDLVKEDPRPMLFGEYYFPVCHEQTDVRINPGLREYFGCGHSDPTAAFAKRQAEAFRPSGWLYRPCVPPGTWTYMLRSKRVIGGAIFASLDDPFYFADGTHAGFAWLHGFWGIIDAWRRPKPEWWLTKLVFSPVWFPVRHVAWTPEQASIVLPVENRYTFTDLSELTFAWELGEHNGVVRADVAPGRSGQLKIPVASGTAAGEKLIIRVTDANRNLINLLNVPLGSSVPRTLPGPAAGAPETRREGKLLLVEGDGFTLVFDMASGDFVAGDSRHNAAVTHFPSPHLTRYDFGDLAGPNSKPYAVFPDKKTRVVDNVTVAARAEGLEIAVYDHYDVLAGSVTWLFDRKGMGKLRYDYVYSGEAMPTREAGVVFPLQPACEEVRWRRWSEWGDVFPEESISRTSGRARAFRSSTRTPDPENVPPRWPWSQDQTELGTPDFRSVKFNVYEASLAAADGRGLCVHARADVHVRPSIADHATLLHVLSRCSFGEAPVKKGDHLSGRYVVELLSRAVP